MDPILTNPKNPYRLFPIRYPALFNMYKNALSLMWTPQEVDLSQDIKDWILLSADERAFIENVLAFFSASDLIVTQNLAGRFMNDVKIQEALFFYGVQMMIENIHTETYALLIDTYVADPVRKDALFDSVQKSETIRDKAEWAFKWIESDRSFAERLIAFALVEGVFFSASFASIYWLKKQGKMPGLCFSNSLISRDEGLHTDFACALYNTMEEGNRLDTSIVHTIFKEAVGLEIAFVKDSLKVDLIGMNSRSMAQYVQFIADRLLVSLGYPVLYNSTNPFDFMDLISFKTKTNFFENRVAEYAKSSHELIDYAADAVF